MTTKRELQKFERTHQAELLQTAITKTRVDRKFVWWDAFSARALRPAAIAYIFSVLHPSFVEDGVLKVLMEVVRDWLSGRLP
jgi:hypothetical protein